MRKTVELGRKAPVDENPGGGMPAERPDVENVEASGFDVQRIRKAGESKMYMAEISRASDHGGNTLAARAYALIHDAILRGQFRPGSRLRIEELVEIFKLSPTPIREALYRLEAVGLIESIPHRGSRVAELSVADLQELFEARLVLEPLAVRKAASRFTPEMADKARACLERLRAAEQNHDFMAAWDAHTDFHYALYEPSGSSWLTRLITPLWESSERYRIELSSLQADLPKRTCEHESMLQACINHQVSRAATEMHEHLEFTGNEIAVQLTGERLFERGNLSEPIATAVATSPKKTRSKKT
jgi:DNA-binding GntR family transcriptional regulator